MDRKENSKHYNVSQHDSERREAWVGCVWSLPHMNSPRVLSPAHITWVMMATHFVGVALARTLHYQFYCWYVGQEGTGEDSDASSSE